jgi:glycosyltransferase involved in cell wall biosynthesis
MNLSILIPLLNEEESLNELYTWIIFLDDGSSDNSWLCIEQFAQANENVKGIRFMKNYGKSQALHAGFAKAQGDVIITMDADLQDSPEEIPGLYDMVINGNYDLVSGWKKKRYDSVVAKNLPSKLFNWAARKTSGVYLNDFNCGLKAYKNIVVKNVEVSGEMHRYIPVLAKNAGFNKIGEKVVQHQARKYGESKFGMSRFINGFLDLITIWFLSRYGKRPMHFFGAFGVLMFIIGFVSTGLIIGIKLFRLYSGYDTILVTSNPLFYIALTSMIIGSQLFLAGFLGEIILRTKNNEERYKIANELN